MAREGLRTELSSAVYRATSEQKKVVKEGIQVKHDGGFQNGPIGGAEFDGGWDASVLKRDLPMAGRVEVRRAYSPLALR